MCVNTTHFRLFFRIPRGDGGEMSAWTPRHGSWRVDPSPQLYDCTSLHPRVLPGDGVGIWHRACRHTAGRHSPRQAPKSVTWRSNTMGPNAHHLAQLLENRTVWILGDSHSLDLWCALTCAMIRSSNRTTLQRSCSDANCAKPQLILSVQTKSPHASQLVESRWRVPTCACKLNSKRTPPSTALH